MPTMQLTDAEVKVITRLRMTPTERAVEIAAEHEKTRQRMTPERRAVYDAECARRAALKPLEKQAESIAWQRGRIDKQLADRPELAVVVDALVDGKVSPVKEG